MPRRTMARVSRVLSRYRAVGGYVDGNSKRPKHQHSASDIAVTTWRSHGLIYDLPLIQETTAS
jgi:hypothetical protein